jgi:hypothetical protein
MFALSAFLYLLVMLPDAMVNGLRWEEFILGLGPASVPAEAPEAGGSAKSVGVDVIGKRSTVVTVTSVRCRWASGELEEVRTWYTIGADTLTGRVEAEKAGKCMLWRTCWGRQAGLSVPFSFC